MANSGNYANPRCVSIRFEDAAGLGITLDSEDGELTLGPFNDVNVEKEPIYTRGQFDGMALTQDLMQEATITVRARNQTLSSASQARISDFIRRTGTFAAAQSVEDDGIWAFKMIVTRTTYNGTTSTSTFPYIEARITENHAFPANTFTIAIRSFQAPTES